MHLSGMEQPCTMYPIRFSISSTSRCSCVDIVDLIETGTNRSNQILAGMSDLDYEKCVFRIHYGSLNRFGSRLYMLRLVPESRGWRGLIDGILSGLR